jgi:DNA-binding PadR family transcriptional regulator
MSGYDMRGFIRQGLSHFWKESYGNIYPLLRRLREEGLVERATERRGGSPDRHVYSLTARGRRVLQEWLEAPTEDEPVVRSELLLKIFFGAELGRERLGGLLRQFRDQQRLRLERLRAAEKDIAAARRKKREAFYWRLTVIRGLLVAEARLRWAEAALREIEKLSPPARRRRSLERKRP